MEARDWIGLPAKADAYLRDHFGLRHAIIQLHRDLTRPMLGLGGAGPDVLVGRDGDVYLAAIRCARAPASFSESSRSRFRRTRSPVWERRWKDEE